MESLLVNFTSGILGVLIGTIIQYYLNRRLKIQELELKARSDLYLQLFSRLRDLNNTIQENHSLICDAQIYASDDVLDILYKFEPDKPFSDRSLYNRLLYDLLVAIRKELRPRSKHRTLKVFVHDLAKPIIPPDAAQ
jgi:hypothetical protein